ncbi:hypothetical protein ABKA04_000763 [Annulohypoxylon sp. FPYF3050]
MREIITLQLGQQSNYLANHFWNAQESYFTYGADEESPVDHDVHFRPGVGSDGTETFMPRTVIYDLKGGFGTLRKINSLYEIDGDPSSSSLWSGQTVIQRQQPIEASAYQESLDTGQATAELTTSTVRYWSDFNRVFYHPKSIIQLSEYELNSTVMPFEKWHMGEELFGSLDKEHDLLDRDLRPFVEEADQMQGVQIMTGIDDAWGGVYSSNLGNITDLLNVFGKQTIANLEMSISEAPQSHQNGTNGTNGTHGETNGLNGRGENVRSLYETGVDGINLEDESEAGSQKGAATLDIDLSSPQDLNLDTSGRRRRKRHIFSQVIGDRGLQNLEQANDDNDRELREQFGMRRRPKFHK